MNSIVEAELICSEAPPIIPVLIAKASHCVATKDGGTT